MPNTGSLQAIAVPLRASGKRIMNRPRLLVINIYSLALVAGLATFAFSLTVDWMLRVFIADLVATLVVFLASLYYRNASLYDPFWSLAPPIIALGLWLTQFENLRLLLMLLFVGIWGIRLTANWLKTWHGLEAEDWRYQALQAKSGRWYGLVSLFGIHLFPTVLVFLGCISLFVVADRPLTGLNYWDLLAVLVTSASIWIEYQADRELHQFRTQRATPTEVINRGLWARCRHPNYLGEMGFWFGLWLFSVAATTSIWQLATLGPLAMIVLFVVISIPMIETKLLAEKPAYAHYQKNTPMLLPRLTLR